MMVVCNMISPTRIEVVDIRWLKFKVPLYLSADKVDKDNDAGHRKYFDINLAVY